MTSSRLNVRPGSIMVAGVVGACAWVLPLSVADAAPYPPIPTTVNAPPVGPGAATALPPAGAPPTPTAPVAAAAGVQGFPGGLVAPGAFPVQAPTGAAPASDSDDPGLPAFWVATGVASTLVVIVVAVRTQRFGSRRRLR